MSRWHTCPDGHSWAVRLEEAENLPICPRCGRTAVPLDEGEVLATHRLGGGEVPIRPSQQAAAVVRSFPGGQGSNGTSENGREPRLPQVPGYDILGILGQGGMGVVYRARQRSLDRFVALKMIRDAQYSTPDELLRFRAEALAVAQITHPHIIRIHEIGEQDGLPYISLELVEGGTLEEWLGDRPQPILDAAAFVEKIARAVQAAHARGLMHRDLKPANLLLDWGAHGARDRLTQATPKVADFGLVKRIGSADGPTLTGQVLGTPSYMAPEQANPSAGSVGPWTDVYALGAILYELLTGRPPFVGPTGMDTLRLVLDCEPVSPRALRRDVPADLETIVLKCLAKDPRQRYLTAEALADDLARFQVGEPIQARPVGLLERLGRRSRRNPVVASLTGVLGLVLLGVVIAGGILWHQGSEHHRLGRETIEKHFAEVADLEARAQESQHVAAFDKALAKLESAQEHLERIREPSLFERAAEMRTRLVLARDQAVADGDFTRNLDTVRFDLLGVELDGKMVSTEGRPLRRFLIDSGIPVGQVAPEELVAAVRARPRIQRAILDALVERYASSLDQKEADDLLAAIDALERNPDARVVLEWLRKEPEKLLEPASEARLHRLPTSYLIVTSSRLALRKNYDGATRLLREGILEKPDEFWLHYNLGHLLQTGHPRRYAAALTPYFAALALRGQSGHTRTNLGLCLMQAGRPDEGLKCLEQARKLYPEFASYHGNFALALGQTGHFERARAELTEALRINPRYLNAHVGMANLELEAGKLVEAEAWFRKALDLCAPDDPDRATLVLRMQRTKQYQRLEDKLARVVAGTTAPASVIEASEMLELCYFKGKHLDAYKLTRRFFNDYPGLEADRRGTWYRFNAACYAALAAAGKGDGAARLSDVERAALRADALRWLQAELTELKRLRDTGAARKQLEVSEALHEWLTDVALAGVRERGSIERFPPAERKAWLELWAEVDVVLENLAQVGR